MLADLRQWLESPAAVSARLLTAPAGVGKTRLALELCHCAAERGWDAGFVTREELERFSAQQNLGRWRWQRPALAVVDYAAAKLPQLRVWFKELAANPGAPERPFRLLLLERHAAAAAGWFWELTGRGDADADAVQELFDPPRPSRSRHSRPRPSAAPSSPACSNGSAAAISPPRPEMSHSIADCRSRAGVGSRSS